MRKFIYALAIVLGGAMVVGAQQSFDLPFSIADINALSGQFSASKLGTGTPANGQVLLYESGAPAWNYPFEFPRTRNARDVTADSTGSAPFVLTSTIRPTAANINVSATVTVAQTGAGSCTVVFLVARSAAELNSTTITDANGETITMTVTATLSSNASTNSSAAPITLRLKRVSGATCLISAGNAELTLSV